MFSNWFTGYCHLWKTFFFLSFLLKVPSFPHNPLNFCFILCVPFVPGSVKRASIDRLVFILSFSRINSVLEAKDTQDCFDLLYNVTRGWSLVLLVLSVKVSSALTLSVCLQKSRAFLHVKEYQRFIMEAVVICFAAFFFLCLLVSF